jgi:hypothetical protein
MRLQIAPHTLERAEERGATIEEIEDVIATGEPFEAKKGRKGKAKVYPFDRERNGRFYEQKRIEAIYIAEEDDLFVTVTVYVFYGKWDR